MNAINVYDYEIDVIMQNMIKDCPYKGLPILMNRNPSLRIGSIQLLFVTKIKPALKENPFPSVTEEPLVSMDNNDDWYEDQSHKRRATDVTSSALFGLSNDHDIIRHKVIRYVEDGAIAVSPLIVKGPNLDLNYQGPLRSDS